MLLCTIYINTKAINIIKTMISPISTQLRGTDIADHSIWLHINVPDEYS